MEHEACVITCRRIPKCVKPSLHHFTIYHLMIVSLTVLVDNEPSNVGGASNGVRLFRYLAKRNERAASPAPGKSVGGTSRISGRGLTREQPNATHAIGLGSRSRYLGITTTESDIQAARRGHDGIRRTWPLFELSSSSSSISCSLP